MGRTRTTSREDIHRERLGGWVGTSVSSIASVENMMMMTRSKPMEQTGAPTAVRRGRVGRASRPVGLVVCAQTTWPVGGWVGGYGWVEKEQGVRMRYCE